MGIAFSSGKNFWMVVKTTPPAFTDSLFSQVGPALRLRRRLPQQVLAAGERAVKLVVQIIPVRKNHDRRVLHRLLADDRRPCRTPSSDSCPTLACATRLPRADRRELRRLRLTGIERPCFGCSWRRQLKFRCAKRLIDGGPDSVKLMVAGHLLLQRPAAVVIEDDEVAYECQETTSIKHAFEHHLEFGQKPVGRFLPGNRAPRLEPLFSRGQRSDARFRPSETLALHSWKQCREFGLVRLELVPCRPDRGVLIGRILKFDQAEWKSVDEQHRIRPSVVFVLRDRELIDRQPIVGCRDGRNR